MKRILLLAATLPCSSFAQAQFQPPGGLPLSTQVGTAKNSDGTASVTLGTMQDGIVTNGSNIAGLQAASVSHDDLSSALASYQTQAVADGKYATQSALSAETTRAQSAEQVNAEDIAAIRSGYVTTGALNSALGAYVTGSALSSALAPYLTQSQAAQTYLPIAGGATTGPLNGANFFDDLVGSSASGATAMLTTDGSGTLNGSNCLQVPPFGVTNLDITAVGVSSNGTDAVMQKFDGMAVFSSDGTPMMSQAGTIINAYPSFGSPGSWSVVASVDGATKCISVTTKAGGSGSWKWRASIHYENFQP